MKRYTFNTEQDWYTAQRILGHLNISYNSFRSEKGENAGYIIEVLA